VERNIYNFDKDNRLENRNTYFYVPFHGREFLDQWRASRAEVLSQSELPGNSFDSDGAVSVGEPPYRTELLLCSLHSSLSKPGDENYKALSIIDKLLLRFEVTKRIYTEYDQDYRAYNRDSYYKLSLYLMFGELLVKALENTKKLTYLNGLLKLLDSLISIKQSLSEKEIQRLAWLCEQERIHVENVMSTVGIKL